MLATPPRRNREEAMDRPGLDPDLLADDLRNLETLNRLFAGRAIVRKHVRAALAGGAGRLRVLDIGSGAGDLCRVAAAECRASGRPVRIFSLDAHPQIQAYARAQCAGFPEIVLIRGDARALPLAADSVDLVLCTLALHHFTEAGAVRVLAEMRRVTRDRAVVSDLRRGRIAYAAVWLATRFTPNPMTRHDGPVSVNRAFTPDELRALAAEAGWEGCELVREPWFRMSLVYRRGTVR